MPKWKYHSGLILNFAWLIKTFKILLPTENVSKISYKQKLIIRNHIWQFCKMNSVACVAIDSLDWTVSILLIFLLFFLVVMIIF